MDDVEKGKTGKEFPADVRVHAGSGNDWHATDCVVDIASHTFSHTDSFADHYQVSGNGSCTGAASSGGGEPDVDVGAFSFVAVVPWTK